MQTQTFLILLFVCLNAAVACVDGLGALGAIPAYSYAHMTSNSTSTQSDPSQAAVQYGNASDLADSWSSNPPTAIGTIGDILGSLPWYFKIIIDIFAGFPLMIAQFVSMFPLDTTGQQVLTVFSVAFSTVWGFLMMSFIVELISGRFLNEK